MIALLLAAATGAGTGTPITPTDTGIASVSISPALRRTRTEVTIGMLSFDRVTRHPIFWLRKTETGQPLAWTDTLRCPAAADRIEAMRAIETRPAPPPNDDLVITMDGVGYEPDAPADMGDRAGRLKLSSNIGTPLAAWAETTLTALSPCWSEEAPKRPAR